MRVSTIHKFVVLYLLSFLTIFQRWNYCNNNSDLLPGRSFSKFRKWGNSKSNCPTWDADFEWSIWYNHGLVFNSRPRVCRGSARFGFLQIFRYSFKTFIGILRFLEVHNLTFHIGYIGQTLFPGILSILRYDMRFH